MLDQCLESRHESVEPDTASARVVADGLSEASTFGGVCCAAWAVAVLAHTLGYSVVVLEELGVPIVWMRVPGLPS